MKTKQYDFSVEYDVSTVSIAPAASKPDLVKIKINDKEKQPGAKQHIELPAGRTTKIDIVVVPEAGEGYKRVYTLNITRKAPNTEARLIKLDVGGGQEMKPDPFVPSTTTYKVSIPRGTASYTITPTPVDPKASITVNGKNVANGQASEPIVSVTPTSTVLVVVTAEDGKTKLTYKIVVSDYNLINKSTNANLSDMKINYADLQPKFKSNVEDYELYVKPDTNNLTITPITESSAAKVEVSVGSKKLTEKNGSYSNSLFINKTTFTIKVTAEDLTEKTYTVEVFRGDKKKPGIFKPITADMVNYEAASPIVVDISNYAVVEAGVFNKLKTEYPDKAILFTGNDYSLKITGKDITALIPHTTQYDFNFSFTTPDQNAIQDILYQDEYDWEMDPVYLYFDDHGPLPGKMILTVSLGREYKNDMLFWNYYNDERERIDYYGYVNSNAKGTFTVPITHLSTYLVAENRIRIAEDKTSANFGSAVDTGKVGGIDTGGNANGSTETGKVPPQTGVKLKK